MYVCFTYQCMCAKGTNVGMCMDVGPMDVCTNVGTNHLTGEVCSSNSFVVGTCIKRKKRP